MGRKRKRINYDEILQEVGLKYKELLDAEYEETMAAFDKARLEQLAALRKKKAAQAAEENKSS